LAEKERQVVLDACLFWHENKWTVEAITVMPDHVHLLVRPLPIPEGQHSSGVVYDLGEIVGSVKKFSARRIQRARGTQGALWQDERHDHVVRDEKDWDEKFGYLAHNAVKRGLAKQWLDYPFFWYRRADTALESGATEGTAS
jgi:REP element-mobilizing transposase RayT